MSKDEQIVLKDEQIDLLASENISLSEENKSLKHELSQLKKMIFGVKSERHISPVSEDQLNLFVQDDTSDQTEQEVTEPITYVRKKPGKKHPGRHPLPAHLPVEETIIEPEEDTTGMVKIRDEVTDTLKYTPASLVIKRIVRPQYARPDGQGVMIGELPSRALPKAIAESSLLSHIVVKKFVDHMPFYRQISGFYRDYQWKVSSSTMNDWFTQLCILLDPLYNRLKEKILDSGYIQVDESPIKVLDKVKKGKSHHGYQWVYHSPEDRLVLFNYRKGRGMHGPKEMLSSYSGILQSDGYTVYDKIGKREDIFLAGCLVHVRRKYVEALDSDPDRANYALDIFKNIYHQETKAKESDDRKGHREEHIVPLLQELNTWIRAEGIKVLPKSPIGKAMKYTLSQWNKITQIFEDGRIELDNNLIENKIRPLALGRKNYLFAGSHAGAQRIAMMYSFMGSCKANDVNPYEWLKYVLDNIGQSSIQSLDQFLPSNFVV